MAVTLRPRSQINQSPLTLATATQRDDERQLRALATEAQNRTNNSKKKKLQGCLQNDLEHARIRIWAYFGIGGFEREVPVDDSAQEEGVEGASRARKPRRNTKFFFAENSDDVKCA